MQYSDHITEPQVKVVDSATDCPELDIVNGQGTVKVMFWPGNGSLKRSMHYHQLQDESSLFPLQHPFDCVYYVLKGAGTIKDGLTGEQQSLVEGSIIHIDKHESYTITAGNDGIDFVGGPCPPDDKLYEKIKSQGEH
ncbi:MAG: hypothetical protein E7J63_17965 [Pantoea sp.]|uniref:hypothetical protein n=1 Tax=Pantoea sp. TaxID=69393 RepID=UPI002906ABED|nr:hypothetical protein [Pantoea sp.]MDU7840178.1 hypothetical protein [Pantoea sp.]